MDTFIDTLKLRNKKKRKNRSIDNDYTSPFRKKPNSRSYKIQPTEKGSAQKLNKLNELLFISKVKGKICGEYLAEARLLEYKVKQILNILKESNNQEVSNQIKSIEKLLFKFIEKTKF